jgi:hypothetical protein
MHETGRAVKMWVSGAMDFVRGGFITAGGGVCGEDCLLAEELGVAEQGVGELREILTHFFMERVSTGTA